MMSGLYLGFGYAAGWRSSRGRSILKQSLKLEVTAYQHDMNRMGKSQVD